MPKKKPSKLALLREICGLTQRELAEMVDRKVFTIRAVEQGRLALSDALAAAISNATGVNAWWLSDKFPPREPYDDHLDDFTRETFETHRARMLVGQEVDAEVRDYLVNDYTNDIISVLKEIEDYEKFMRALLRVAHFREKLKEEFLAPEENPKKSEESER